MNCQSNRHLLQSYLRKLSKSLVISFALTEIAFGSTIHRVNKKDTLSNIVYARFGSPLYGAKGRLKTVIALNPHLVDPDHLKPGDLIFFPDAYVEIEEPYVAQSRAQNRLPASFEEIGKFIFGAGTGGIEIQQYDKDNKITSRVISKNAHYVTLGMDQSWSEDSQFNIRWDLAKVKFDQPDGIALSKTDFLLSKFSGTYLYKISDKLKFGLKTEFAHLPQLQRNNTTTAKIETPWIPVVSPSVIYNNKINRHYEAGLEGTVGYVLPSVISTSETYSGYGYELKPYISMSLKKVQVWTEASWSEINFSDAGSDIKVQELKFMLGIKIPIIGD